MAAAASKKAAVGSPGQWCETTGLLAKWNLSCPLERGCVQLAPLSLCGGRRVGRHHPASLVRVCHHRVPARLVWYQLLASCAVEA